MQLKGIAVLDHFAGDGEQLQAVEAVVSRLLAALDERRQARFETAQIDTFVMAER